MPKLKLTYLQIKEQAARDIRRRTLARRAQLLEEHRQRTARDKGTQTEDFENTDSDTEVRVVEKIQSKRCAKKYVDHTVFTSRLRREEIELQSTNER